MADPARLQDLLGSPEPDAAAVVIAARQRLRDDGEALALHDEVLTELSLSAEGERVVSHRIAELVAWQDTAWARR